jgi:hypothetical protein
MSVPTYIVNRTMFYKKHYRNNDGESCSKFLLRDGHEIEITDKDARKIVGLMEIIQYFNDKALV